jgi:hypothetical protein
MTAVEFANPIELLGQMIEAGDKRMAASAYGGRDGPALSALLRAHLLGPDGLLGTTICDACEHPHVVDIEFGGDGSCGWYCPEAGYVPADREALVALAIDTGRIIPAIGAAFSEAFGERRWTPRPLGPEADGWIIGAWQIGGGWTTVALARRLDSTDVARGTASALAALAPNDAGLVLTTRQHTGFEPPRRFTALPLEVALILDSAAHLSASADAIIQAVTPHFAVRLAAHAGRPGVAAKVHTVLDCLRARGTLPSSATALAGAVARAWPEFYAGEPPPAASTLRRHVKE